MFELTALNHVGVAVFDLEEAASIYESKFHLSVSEVVESKTNGIKVRLVNTKNSILELMEPIEKTSTVAKFLEKQGRNSVHHIAFSVNKDLEAVARDLETAGVEMVAPKPTIGVMGHPVNFCHPSFTGNILIELCDVRGDESS